MFSKKVQTDVKKSAYKILDPKKDTATRFKHLKFLLDNSDENESKHLFESNYSSIYQIFYESFISVEANLKQRVTKIHRDELDTILIILEKVLTLCPEIVAQRWQCHSMCMIITKLLHPENSWRLRRDGIKFFILWYQILGHNAPDSVHAIFATLVPGFSSPIPEHPGLAALWNNHLSSINLHENLLGPVSTVETNLLYAPQMGEKQPDDVVKYYLESLLELMVNQVPRIMWKDLKNCQRRCFNYLFEKFKQFYLPAIFPDYSTATNVYKQTTDLPDCSNQNRNDTNSSCRVCVIKWLAGYTQDIKQKHYPNIPLISKFMGDKAQLVAFEIVRDTLYKSRENVNLIHEIFRQAFLLNFSWAMAIRRTIAVYKDWIQLSVSQQPPFMLDPDGTNVQMSSLDNNAEEIPPVKYEPKYGDIRAGFQNVIQLFMTNALHVFVAQSGTEYPMLLEEQVDTCKRVLNIYRYMVMHTYMSLKTWEQLLNVLLRITTLVLNKKPPRRKEDTLSGKLAPAIFQTLIVTWIKANLNVPISEKLWDQFLTVLCSLTQWEELIREWSKTLETLTRVLARHVYGLDLADLPLDRISDKKSRRKRGSTTLNSTYNMCNLSHTRVNQQRGSVTDNQSDNTTKRRTFIKRSNSDSDISYYLFQKYSDTDTVFNITETPTTDDLKYNWKDEKSSKCLFNVRKCHSLENLSQLLMLRMRDTHSRSPSPVPSTGMESSLFKEAHMQIEIMSSQHPSSEKVTNKKSVMSGGDVRGWTPDVAAILWRRMLSALGDVNTLENPLLHEQVFQYLLDLSTTMTKIYQNQGMVEEETFVSLELVPPISVISPWCFQALKLPKAYRNGKLHAYKLLCQMTLNNRDMPQGQKYVTQFFKVLHYGLTSSDQEVVNTILKNTGSEFFSHQLPGFTLLTLDFVHACNEVLSGTNVVLAPRAEAVSILGSLLSFPSNLTKVPYLKPDCHQFVITYCPDIKDTVITIMLKVAKREPSALARCISLSNLGIFLCQELSNNSKHPCIKEAIITLLHALQFKNEKISQVACDNVLLLCDYIPSLLKHYPDIPPKVLEVLSATLANMLPIGDRNKRLLTSLVFCLAEWTMCIPVPLLLELRSKQSLSMTVFMVIDALSRTCNDKTIEHLKKATEVNLEYSNEFTFDITLDNLKSSESKSNNKFGDHIITPTHLNSTRHSLQIATRMIINHLLNHLGQFPMLIGPARLCSMVSEHDDTLNSISEQLTIDIFTVPSIQLFMSITNMLVMSIIELPALETPGGGITAGLRTGLNQVRVLQRDLVGKSCWDISPLYCGPNYEHESDDNLFIINPVQKNNEAEESIVVTYSTNCQTQHTIRHRAPNVLPTFENSADDLDNLDDLLQYVGYTSSECLEDMEILLNNPAVKSPMTSQLEQDIMSTILGQRFMDNSYTEKLNTVHYNHMEKRPQCSVHKSPFQNGRALFSELGFTSWDQRRQIYQLERNEKVLRELRVLDAQCCRDTHKIAIIYVAEGQEDKVSIISNTGGSQAYEDFISALAWEVELETHNGFMGGLQRNKNAGTTTPYYSTSFMEVVFHVATRMPTTTTQEAYIQKARHLGNDEVHIVWSEHSKDYRRGIIPTEFCDVLIIIYPLPNNLYRIQVSRKPEVPYFGPLYNEVIVQKSILANVVRCTAINASCAKRSMIPFYQQYYEERWRSLDMIMKNYKHSSTFEEFISNVYSPVQTTSPFQQQPYLRSNSEKYKSDDFVLSGSSSSNLAAALIDSSHRNRNTKGLSIDWSKKNGTDVDVLISAGISPRPHKKLTSHQSLMR
ncbi:ral GTPase-activating protein subunit alpha-1 isoform X1 [Rhopalosiphum maidis]|uniref:ral GTPase-activating protein subunit alpha-1 isoform X1 n=1 Tax=Rhopalosiphum maidis TaxID=43146 RepID=UPI000EFDE153|nr:ral GTPase-activating protein subunit alpha-1 isoform X1 [Rhopalosiphum maidis]XP_026816589.1 ral GTPase-activating protein subunit alpha-1 isoform X1 [Rhopalosiphum maidis]